MNGVELTAWFVSGIIIILIQLAPLIIGLWLFGLVVKYLRGPRRY